MKILVLTHLLVDADSWDPTAFERELSSSDLGGGRQIERADVESVLIIPEGHEVTRTTCGLVDIRPIRPSFWSAILFPETLQGGQRVRHGASPETVVTLTSRKADGSGWWIDAGGGLADWALVRSWEQEVHEGG